MSAVLWSVSCRGAGATIASFIAYATEKKIGRFQRPFWQGGPARRGGSQSANNSSAVGSFIPLLVLGVPGSETTAVMLAALSPWGHPRSHHAGRPAGHVLGCAASMFLGNLVLIVLNLPMVKWLAKILLVPRWILMPASPS